MPDGSLRALEYFKMVDEYPSNQVEKCQNI